MTDLLNKEVSRLTLEEYQTVKMLTGLSVLSFANFYEWMAQRNDENSLRGALSGRERRAGPSPTRKSPPRSPAGEGRRYSRDLTPRIRGTKRSNPTRTERGFTVGRSPSRGYNRLTLVNVRQSDEGDRYVFDFLEKYKRAGGDGGELHANLYDVPVEGLGVVKDALEYVYGLVNYDKS